MDRLEFDMNRPDGRGTYLVYHINIRPGEKLVFDVGEESSREQNYMPEPYLSCNSGGIDQGLMRRINANIDEVYIVYPKNNKRFQVSKVVTASSYTKSGSVITYDSPKYRFRFDTEFGTIGENIAINNPGAKVYFEGKLENECTGSFLFRQLAPQSLSRRRGNKCHTLRAARSRQGTSCSVCGARSPPCTRNDRPGSY